MLTDSFLEFINEEKLFKVEDHLLLAISGGVDSVVLAHLLYQTGYKFSLAHMNFQLRGNDSILDQKFVENLAKELNVTCHVKRVEVKKGKAKHGNSTQMQARKLRYDWFAELLSEYDYKKLLTAHHAEDSFETVLLNLTRGTGIKGVRGILPVSEMLARPLLFADKSSILAYAKKHHLQWREDISNQSDNYKRNDIRHHVIPKLKVQNPALFEAFNSTALRLRAAEASYDEKIADLKRKYSVTQADKIVISKKLLDLQFGLVYLSEFLKPYHFSFAQIAAFSFSQSGSRLEGSTHYLAVDREELILSPNNEDLAFLQKLNFKTNEGTVKVASSIDGRYLKWEVLGITDFISTLPKNVAMIDFDLLKIPVLLRNWKEGDKMQPLGMRGRKKVSDILIDAKTSIPDKEKQLVLESGGEIVWLINHRISENYKITKQTSTILRLEYHEIT